MSFGLSLDDQNDRVQIEGQTGKRLGKMKEFLSELIGHHNDLTDHFSRKSLEEPSKGGLIG
jgi:hypothetical protein